MVAVVDGDVGCGVCVAGGVGAAVLVELPSPETSPLSTLREVSVWWPLTRTMVAWSQAVSPRINATAASEAVLARLRRPVTGSRSLWDGWIVVCWRWRTCCSLLDGRGLARTTPP